MTDYDPYKELRKTLMSTLVIIKSKNAKIVELTKEVYSLKKDKEYYKNSCDEYVNRCDEQRAEIERLKTENYHLQGYTDSVVKRMQHLFQSKTINQFDEIDRRTHQYKKDVTKFDEEFKRYKEAFEKMSEEKVFSVDLSIGQIKAEAVKEYETKLLDELKKTKMYNAQQLPSQTSVWVYVAEDVRKAIDKVSKEMGVTV